MTELAHFCLDGLRNKMPTSECQIVLFNGWPFIGTLDVQQMMDSYNLEGQG
jgi:hypothetical protein